SGTTIFSINGSVENSSNPTWFVLDGPAVVNSPASLSTTVTFTGSGTAHIQLIAPSDQNCGTAYDTLALTAFGTPAAPSTTPASRCGAGTVVLGASGGTDCDSLIWFSDAALTTRVNVGSSFSPNLSATTTYYVICKSIHGCVSPSTPVTGTITGNPAAPA